MRNNRFGPQRRVGDLFGVLHYKNGNLCERIVLDFLKSVMNRREKVNILSKLITKTLLCLARDEETRKDELKSYANNALSVLYAFEGFAIDSDEQKIHLEYIIECWEEWDEEYDGPKPKKPFFPTLNPRVRMIYYELVIPLRLEVHEMNQTEWCESGEWQDVLWYPLQDLALNAKPLNTTHNFLSLVQRLREGFPKLREPNALFPAMFRKAERALKRYLRKNQ